jgi:pyridoxine 4-dehydrogenase
MRLTGSAAFRLGTPSDRERSIAVLRRAVELGVNHIDTAAFYFSSLRSANELIISALGPYPDDLVVVTRVGPWRDHHGEWASPARPDQLRGHVEENLRRLGRDHLDVVNFRRTAHQWCVQNRYALDRPDPVDDEVLRGCAERDIAFVPFYAVAGDSGPRGATENHDEAVLVVAREHGASPAQVRIAWTLHQGPHVLAVPGTGNPDHLADHVAAGALRRTEAEPARLSGGRTAAAGTQ